MNLKLEKEQYPKVALERQVLKYNHLFSNRKCILMNFLMMRRILRIRPHQEMDLDICLLSV